MATEHATSEEIREQPAAATAMLEELESKKDALDTAFEPSTSICLVGCGTSYYLSETGSSLLSENAVGLAFPGSEVFMSRNSMPKIDFDLVVPVSRSGESTETVRAAKTLSDRHPESSVVAITCTAGSQIDDFADVSIVSPEGDEESIVMTKSFTSMLVALEYCTSFTLDGESPTTNPQQVSNDMRTVLREADSLAENLGTNEELERFVFLGGGEFYGLAAESMLKIEELTLSWTKAYHPLEFRHGPKSIADDRTLVSVFVPNRNSEEYVSLVEDVRGLGAETLTIGTKDALAEVESTHEFPIPDREHGPSLSLYMPLFQLLGYYRAVSKNLDPDNPKNLTQVVQL